jgi:[acyl-carrier-protein] S-malonyltransferase
MKAYVFPGQGAQFSGMGRELYDKYSIARQMFEEANNILGFNISELMFTGSDEDLKQTRVTQPAIFLHSVIMAAVMGDSFTPQMVAGHSLGEFSALVANKTLSFADALKLVSKRAMAMQKACEVKPSTMAAIIGTEDGVVEEVCSSINEIVVPANYNSPGQIVISGSIEGIDAAIEILKERGAKRALKLAVGGAFHSPLMEPARQELEQAIESTPFSKPVCPIFQNVDALPSTDPEKIKANLAMQLISPVRWTQTVQNMISAGATSFTEIGPGAVLQGLIKKVDKDIAVSGASV